MSKKKVQQLENENAGFALEILLNESAIYEAEKEIQSLEEFMLSDEDIGNHIQTLRLLIERIDAKNRIYKESLLSD